MEDYRRQAKIESLNKAFPGKSCGNPRCEELCAEAYDAAKSMRLDPADAVRRTIERELCCPQADSAREKCRFGFMLQNEDELVHIFRAGTDECEKCKSLDGTRVSRIEWSDEDAMREKGFWKQKNGRYLPHPHCKCHWEEKAEKLVFYRTNDSSFTGEEAEFSVKGHPAKLGYYIVKENIVNGFEDLLNQLENRYKPHSVGHLRIIGHGNAAHAPVDEEQSAAFQHLVNSTKPEHRKIVLRLKKMFSDHAILEFRMCSVGTAADRENGPVFVQKLANLLGCRIKVFLEPINAYGGKRKHGLWMIPADYEIYAPAPNLEKKK